MTLAACVVEDVSIDLDTLTWKLEQFGAYCVCCLSCTIKQSCNGIHYFGGRHLWCRRTLLCEYSTRAWIVFHCVTSAFVLLILRFQLRTFFLRWQMSISAAKWTVLCSICASRIFQWIASIDFAFSDGSRNFRKLLCVCWEVFVLHG